MARLLRFAIFACLLAIAIGAMLAAGNLNSRAVQNPSMFIDMDPTGNTYTASPTNSMTVGTIENCLTTSPPEPLNHDHFVHLIIQNVEDLVGWQARFNYIGDKMAMAGFNAEPFTDGATEVGFINLPRGAAASTSHRSILFSGDIPPLPPDGTNTPQTARIGAVYNGAVNFPISPDTPPKGVAEPTTNASGTPVNATPSYSAPTGGVLAELQLNVVGNETGNPSLFMNLDDGNPNTPGSSALVFTGSATMEINLASGALGDGYHGEGATCSPLNCVTNECPPVDSDGDGWSDAAETVIGTDPFDACADNAADDAWPADISNDTFSDTADIAVLTGNFGRAVPPAPARANIAPDPPDAFVDTADIARLTNLFGRSCIGF